MSIPVSPAGAGGAAAPHDFAVVITRVATFEPSTDVELLRFMSGEVAAMVGYADALGQLYETCVSGEGLDPTAMQGLAEYAGVAAETARAMSQAHKQFTAIYAEVIAAVNNGVVMPYRGRFFTGEAS